MLKRSKSFDHREIKSCDNCISPVEDYCLQNTIMVRPDALREAMQLYSPASGLTPAEYCNIQLKKPYSFAAYYNRSGFLSSNNATAGQKMVERRINDSGNEARQLYCKQ